MADRQITSGKSLVTIQKFTCLEIYESPEREPL